MRITYSPPLPLGLGPNPVDKLHEQSWFGQINDGFEAVAPDVTPVGGITPLIVSEGKVLVWMDGTGVHGLNDGSSGTGNAAALGAPTAGASLHRWRTAVARIKSGVTGAKAKVAILGDSWAEMVNIPREFSTSLNEWLGVAAEGFRPAFGGASIGASTLEMAGWDVTDGSVTSVFPFGVGPDGNAASTASTTATMKWSNIVATEIRIYTQRYGGTWRYRVDGGAWVTQAQDNTNKLGVRTISGLSDAAHTLEIDTTGNTATVCIVGFYATRAAAGIEVLKMGNGGLTGLKWQSFTQYITEPLANMMPDVAVVILGTNDQKTAASPPSEYVAALQAVVNAARTAVPDMGFVFVVPPQSDITAVTPLSAYRNALMDWAIPAGHEVISALDRWPSWAVGNGHGLWMDASHLSTPLGSRVFADDIISSFLKR